MRTCLSGLKKLVKVDITLWDAFLAALAEVIGTAMLVFMGCMGCIGTMGPVPTPIQIALTFGLAVMTAIEVFTGVIVLDGQAPITGTADPSAAKFAQYQFTINHRW